MSSENQELRLFTTTAAVRYDRALHKSKVMNPLPEQVAQPLPTDHWPPENVALLERFREWLVAGGSSTGVINQHRLPMAGHVLGLALKPYPQLDLEADLQQAFSYIQAKNKSETWEKNCFHSLRWFRMFLELECGLVLFDRAATYGDAERYKAGLPDWLLRVLEKQLHHHQGNWRLSRQAQAAYQFWCKYTVLWRWLFENADYQNAAEISRSDIFDFIDEMLVAGYAPQTINAWLYSFQSTLHFMDERGTAINRRLLMVQGLKTDDALPRFLTTEQVTKVRHALEAQVQTAQTAVQIRDSLFNRAVFTLLWQTGMRLSELEDLTLNDINLVERHVLIRRAKGLKDRVVYLTDTVVTVLTEYLAVRGPALSDHLFIYRHKQLSKDLVRLRVTAAGKQVGVYVTPHMLRHTFATQLLNSGCKVTSIQMLLGHKRLNTTMVYARVHDETLVKDYYQAMAKIEADHLAVKNDDKPIESKDHRSLALLAQLESGQLDEQQRVILQELRRCLGQLVVS